MSRAESPIPRAAAGMRAAAALLVCLPFAVLGLLSVVRESGAVPNPHGAFREDCALCHGADSWKPARVSRKFDHAKFGFPLAGAHAAANCTACHASLDFSQEKRLCASCHEDPHLGEMGSDCARCHTARSFIDRAGMVRAHQLTSFPLTGAHAGLDCETCHPPAAQGRLQYVNTRAECETCHLEDYRATQAPDHVAAAFPTDCRQCHSTLSWGGRAFDHAGTAFPLTGAHRSTACSSCHGDGVYAGKSAECVACHREEYDATTSPGHVAAGYSLACATCHGTASWSGASFDHGTTAFPLTGAHRTAACQSCHVGGVYGGTSAACVSCHRTDYDLTANPPHASAGFGTDCATCHNTTGWSGANFDHDTSFFPIYSGTHRGRWNACLDCHNTPANYAVFNCLGCHPHDDRNETDNHHEGESGYSYDSAACYSCHPRGRE